MVNAEQMLKNRNIIPEEMDRPDLEVANLRPALDAVSRVHKMSGSVHVVWKHLRATIPPGQTQLNLLDIACGNGDLLRSLVEQAALEGVTIEATGLDRNPDCVSYARMKHGARSIHFITQDALAPIYDRYDFVMSAFFLHQLGNDDARKLLEQMMHTARIGVFVYDLKRCPLGLGLAWAGTRLLTRSRIAQIDAVRSVKAAFSVAEVRDLARAAKLTPATVVHAPNRRFLLCWVKQRGSSV